MAASVTPQAGPLDRLFVYLTAEGPPLSWLLVSDRPRPLDASRIPPARHSEWNLPVGRRAVGNPPARPAAEPLPPGGAAEDELCWGPAASVSPSCRERRSFSGTVDLRFAEARKFDVEAFGPQPVRPGGERLVRRGPRPEPPRPHVELRAADRLARGEAAARGEPAGRGSTGRARIALVSVCRRDGGRSAQGRVFLSRPCRGRGPFRFSLDPAGRLTSVAVNGRLVRVQHRGDAVTVPSLPSERWNRVEIVYKTSSVGHRFREDRLGRGAAGRRRRSLSIPLVVRASSRHSAERQSESERS